MIDENKIEQLLSAFYEGNTTPDEEEVLLEYFNNNEINEKFHADRELFNALHDASRIPFPEGVSERLEHAIDKHITKKSASKIRILYISIVSAAAVILLCISLFFITDKRSHSDFIADTFTNPEEAALAAEQALLFVSSKLNQGLSPLEKVKESISITNKVLNESLKLN